MFFSSRQRFQCQITTDIDDFLRHTYQVWRRKYICFFVTPTRCDEGNWNVELGYEWTFLVNSLGNWNVELGYEWTFLFNSLGNWILSGKHGLFGHFTFNSLGNRNVKLGCDWTLFFYSSGNWTKKRWIWPFWTFFFQFPRELKRWIKVQWTFHFNSLGNWNVKLGYTWTFFVNSLGNWNVD